jgi:hypothetical protein
METTRKIFDYCERALDPSFWAEPLNALTNLGFIFGAFVALMLLIRRPAEESKLFRFLLILNLFAIGIGSFLVHTYATPWAAAADVIPIGVFMLLYLGYALYAFAGLPFLLTIPAIAGFAYVIEMANRFKCGALTGMLPILERTNCLNNSFGYMPALGALLLIGLWLIIRRHPAAPYVLGAGLVFVVSITFRALDWTWCQQISFMDKARGTHFLWHLLNSTVLFLLVLGAVRHGGRRNFRRDAASQQT